MLRQNTQKTHGIVSCVEQMDSRIGKVPVIGLYKVKVGKLYQASNKNF